MFHVTADWFLGEYEIGMKAEFMRSVLAHHSIKVVFVLAAVFADNLYSQFMLDVVCPPENQRIVGLDSIAVYGACSRTSAEIRVNGFRLRTYENGAFSGFIPLPKQENVLNFIGIDGLDTVNVARKVQVSRYWSAIETDSIFIDSLFRYPRNDLELRPGDDLVVAFKGTPGLSASYKFKAMKEPVLLRQAESPNEFAWLAKHFGINYLPRTPGIYYGVFKISEGSGIFNEPVEFILRTETGVFLREVSKGRVTVNSMARQARMLLLQFAHFLSGADYPEVFIPRTALLEVIGKRGEDYRVRLGDETNIWVPAKNVEILESGSEFLRNVIDQIDVKDLTNRSRISFAISAPATFKIEQLVTPPGLVLTFFNTTASVDQIRYDSKNTLIDHISIENSLDARFVIHLSRKQQWGFRGFYDDGKLILEIKKPPLSYDLKNMLICVDPGHGPDPGAIGSHRLTEKDANFRVAEALKRLLEKKGADVYLTRELQHGASRSVRKKIASYLEADLMIGIGHGSISNQPRPISGTASTYYNPQSHALASEIQLQLLAQLKLPDQGVFYGSEEICKISQMPVVLVQPSSIAHPADETLVQLKGYQERAAEAVVKGIQQFLKKAKKDGQEN